MCCPMSGKVISEILSGGWKVRDLSHVYQGVCFRFVCVRLWPLLIIHYICAVVDLSSKTTIVVIINLGIEAKRSENLSMQINPIYEWSPKYIFRKRQSNDNCLIFIAFYILKISCSLQSRMFILAIINFIFFITI